MRSRLSIAVSATVAACALVGVSQASASTLAVDAGGTLRFHASSGEVNNVDATDVNTPNTMVVTDSGSTIHAGNGCVQVSAHEAQCTEAQFQDFAIALADGDDFAHAFALALLTRITITGGYGDDTIEDLPQTGAYVSGGPGVDTITVHPNFGGRVGVHGDGGDDSITATSASGVVDGDAGDDQVTLHTFIEPPSGTPPSAAYGGTGDDSIAADGGTDMSLIDGEGGDDTLTTTGFATVSVINGSGGADAITATGSPFPFAETINGGTGRDTIDGSGGGDTIDCGPAIDRYVVYAGDAVANCEIAF